MLARNFDKIMNRSGKRIHQSEKQHFRQGGDLDNRKRREDLQCFECGSFSHMRSDCHVAQTELKCPECRSNEHMRSECPNSKKKIGKPLQ